MAKSTVTTPVESSVETTVATTVATEVAVDLGPLEKRLALVETKLDELANSVERLRAAAPADDSGFAGALAALEARVSSYIGRGK